MTPGVFSIMRIQFDGLRRGRNALATLAVCAGLLVVSGATWAQETGQEQSDEPISGMVVDLQNGQVFVPELGWVGKDAFFEFYYATAARFVGDGVDYEGIMKLHGQSD